MTLRDFTPVLYLASGSPARLEMLRNLEIEVYPFPQDCLEFTTETEPGKVVESLSKLKLDSFMKSPDFKPEIPALACDTLLWFENRFIGKAHSPEEAREQISSLAGKVHRVYSGYSICYKGKVYSGSDCAGVEFTQISEENLDKYIASNQWKGAAGSYHIFGMAVDFVKTVDGDVNTVIGLPLDKLTRRLATI